MNPWITHVKEYSKKHNMKYNDCLKDSGCKSSYKKSKNQDGKGILSDGVNVAKKLVKKAVKNKLNNVVDMGTTKVNKMVKDKLEEVIGKGIVNKKKQSGKGLMKDILKTGLSAGASVMGGPIAGIATKVIADKVIGKGLYA